MRPIFTILILLTALISFAQSPANLNLKFPGDLYYSRVPGANKSIRMTLQNKIPSVLVVATDNTNSSRLQREQSFLNGQGRRAFLLALPVLYNFSQQNNTLVFQFGEKGAENNLDQAVVRITYQNAAASPGKPMNRQPLILPVSDPEILTVPLSGVPQGDISGKQFLQVEASPEKTVTISIDREAQRGKVFVGIFSQKTGNLITALNPKDPENNASVLSFTVDETVLILPVIQPSVKTADNNDNVVFEVGDPLEVATVTVTEE